MRGASSDIASVRRKVGLDCPTLNLRASRGSVRLDICCCRNVPNLNQDLALGQSWRLNPVERKQMVAPRQIPGEVELKAAVKLLCGHGHVDQSSAAAEISTPVVKGSSAAKPTQLRICPPPLLPAATDFTHIPRSFLCLLRRSPALSAALWCVLACAPCVVAVRGRRLLRHR